MNQLLTLLLVVALIGTSVLLGIQMFSKYHKTSVQQNAILDMKNLAQMTIEWWKTPQNNGGSGFKNPLSSDDVASIKGFIAFPRNNSDHYVSENGIFNLSITGNQEVTIQAETQYPDVSPVLIVSLADNTQELQ